MSGRDREWKPPPMPSENVVKKEPSMHIYAPLLYAPLLPMIRIGLRNRLPKHQVDRVFMSSVFVALGHAGYIMFSDSSV